MEGILFYIGQALGIIAVVLGFIMFQVKTRERLLIVHMATISCFVVHYFCIGAWAGMAMNAVGFVRNLLFYRMGKDGKVSRFWAIFFAVVMGVLGTTTSLLAKEGLYFLLMVSGLMINSFSMSFSDPNNIRKSILVSSPLVLLYNCFALSVGGAVYEAVAMISAVIGIIRFKKEQ